MTPDSTPSLGNSLSQCPSMAASEKDVWSQFSKVLHSPVSRCLKTWPVISADLKAGEISSKQGESWSVIDVHSWPSLHLLTHCQQTDIPKSAWPWIRNSKLLFRVLKHESLSNNGKLHEKEKRFNLHTYIKQINLTTQWVTFYLLRNQTEQ